MDFLPLFIASFVSFCFLFVVCSGLYHARQIPSSQTMTSNNPLFIKACSNFSNTLYIQRRLYYSRVQPGANRLKHNRLLAVNVALVIVTIPPPPPCSLDSILLSGAFQAEVVLRANVNHIKVHNSRRNGCGREHRQPGMS